MNSEDEIIRMGKIIDGYEKAEVKRLVEADALNFLKNQGYVMPQEDYLREEYLSIFFEKLENDDTRIKKDGHRLIVVDAKGYEKDNEQGTRAITVEDLFASTAKRFFKKSDNPQSDKSLVAKSNDLPDIKSMEDYYKLLNTETDPSKCRTIREHYNRLVAEGAITN